MTNLLSETKAWCCPFTDTVTVSKYLLFVNKNCLKKATPHPGYGQIVCNNPTCKRKMFVSRLKKVINVELLLTSKKEDTKQIKVALTDSTIINATDMNKEEIKIENDLLSLKDYDVT